MSDERLFVALYISSFGPAQPLVQWKSVVFRGIQWLGRAASHSLPSNADRTYTSNPSHVIIGVVPTY